MKTRRLRTASYTVSEPLIEEGVFILQMDRGQMTIRATKPNKVAMQMIGLFESPEETSRLTRFVFETTWRVTGRKQQLK